jgi:hypothetical protein
MIRKNPQFIRCISGLHDMIAHGIEHELGRRAQLELVHHGGAVGLDSFQADYFLKRF